MPRFENDPVVSVNADESDQAIPAVEGVSARVVGVWGQSGKWIGVYGRSESGGWGVYGEGPVGAAGVGQTWVGVYGETKGTVNGPAGVWGEGGPGASASRATPAAMASLASLATASPAKVPGFSVRAIRQGISRETLW